MTRVTNFFFVEIFDLINYFLRPGHSLWPVFSSAWINLLISKPGHSSERLQKKSKDLILIGDDSDGSEEEDDETALAQEDTRDVYDDIYNSIME